ncbi:MAG: hypothetical protein ACMVY4_16130 [Minwuia sp.]|uniref:hypothetical protein n=1 Tax=Minwuia sp. TaxID=2493630 RepID=UPI003A88CFBD
MSRDGAPLNATAKGATISIAEAEAVDRNALARRLVAAGYRVSGDPSTAELVARFAIDVGQPHERTFERKIPEFERVERVEVINGEFVTFNEERFVGYFTETFVETVYAASATLTVTRSDGSDDPVHVSRAQTEGICGNRAVLAPRLMDVLFDTPNGSTRRVEMPDCG